jgi:hypothetical protein
MVQQLNPRRWGRHTSRLWPFLPCPTWAHAHAAAPPPSCCVCPRCRQLLSEQEVQARAADAARANVESHFTYICNVYTDFCDRCVRRWVGCGEQGGAAVRGKGVRCAQCGDLLSCDKSCGVMWRGRGRCPVCVLGGCGEQGGAGATCVLGPRAVWRAVVMWRGSRAVS